MAFERISGFGIFSVGLGYKTIKQIILFCNLIKSLFNRKTYSSTDWDGNLVNRLAESGFYYLNSLGGQLNTCCRSCGVEITSWSQDDNVDDRHRQVSPQCR